MEDRSFKKDTPVDKSNGNCLVCNDRASGWKLLKDTSSTQLYRIIISV